MARNYTLSFTHPDGATATFIYDNGELNALAKGLDPEQFWVFKQVKAYLLRNEEDDIAIAVQMMGEQGFSYHLMNALPEYMQEEDEEDDLPDIQYRTVPGYEVIAFSPAQTVSEIHWREGDAKAPPPPHKQPAVARGQAKSYTTPVTPYNPAQTQQTVSEIHWREGDAKTE